MFAMYSNRRRLFTIVASCALFASAGCATSNNAADEPAAEAKQAQQAQQADTPDAEAQTKAAEKREPLRPDRAMMGELNTRAFEKLMATPVAAKWKEKDATDEPALIVIDTFKNDVGAGFGPYAASLRSKIESRVVNESGADVLSVDTAEESFDILRRTQGAAKAKKARAEFERNVEAAYIIQGTLSADKEISAATDTATFTLELDVLAPKTKDVVAQVKHSVTTAR